MNTKQPFELSESGVARRNQMLKELKHSVGENKRRKKRRRVSALITLLLATTGLVCWQFAAQPEVRTVTEKRATDNVSDSSPSIPPAADQQKAESKVLEFGFVSEEEILGLLNDVGQPTALVEIDNEWVAIPLDDPTE